MALIDDPKVAFAALRPVCVPLMREQTVGNVERLCGQLRGVSDAALQQLQEYVLFPLRFILKSPGSKKESLIHAVVECVGYVLANTCVQSWDLLRAIFSELCLCLCSPTNPGKPAPVSEELKMAVLKSLDALLHAAYGDILLQLYQPAMLPGMGLAISLLLELGDREKARNVQAAALKCLQVLLLQCDCPEGHVSMTQDEKRILGSTFASFLPGITVSLSRVVTGDVKQGHAVTVSAMRIWYKTVGLVMADDQFSRTNDIEKPAVELGRAAELVVQVNEEWAKDTSAKLAILLKKIIACTSAHQHWKVRLELAEFANHLLSSCRSYLGDCIGLLLEALVGLVNDDNTTVQERCNEALHGIAQRNLTEQNQMLTDVLSENLHSLATVLPRLMRTSDDRHKIFTLNVFLGYLKMLGPRVGVVLNSAAHLQRVSKALMQVLELDVTDVHIVEGRSSQDVEELESRPYETQAQRKYFQCFTDVKIFTLLRQICRSLGYYGDLYLLVDHFIDLYRESSIYRKQAALVLNEVIAGAAGIDMEETQKQNLTNQEDVKAAVTSIIEEYISPSNWYLATNKEESQEGENNLFGQSHMLSITNEAQGDCLQFSSVNKVSTVRQMNSNIWQICIQLEGIGCFAVAMGMEFRLLLLTTLYPVLEKAGDATLLISQSALGAMRDICSACRYESLKDLISENSDYLVNDISLNLQRLSQHPHATCVLSVIFSHSDINLLPLVEDIIQDVLMALDHSYNERALMFCTVLLSLMKAIARWFPAKGGGEHTGPASEKEAADREDVFDARQFLLDYRRQKELAEGNGGEEEEDMEDTEPAPPAPEPEVDLEPDGKAALPPHIAIAKEVMERCIHLLSDPSLQLRLKVLDVLELSVGVLRSRERELLPMAHRVWPPLLRRLTGDDPLAVLRAFRVLCTLGESCGDFLRSRVSREVLPQVTGSLVKQATVSAKAGPIYTHTLAYKLQLAVLEGLGALCLRLDLGDADLAAVYEACLPYLSCRQPPKLQEACLSVFQHLIQIDPDALWFALNELHCPHVYEPEYPELHAMRLTGMGRPRNEFTDNIVKLLAQTQ